MNETQNNWNSCSEGELTRLGQGLRAEAAKEKRTTVLGRSVLAVAAAVLLVVGIQGLTSLDQGGITCSACIAQFDAYHAHLVDDDAMDTRLAQQMADHFDKCVLCREKFDSAYPGVLAGVVQTAGLGAILICATLLGIRSRA